MHLQEIQIATFALPEQLAFYARLFGAPLQPTSARQTSFQVGASRLTFKHPDVVLPGVYHYAFNIPENQLDEAKLWVRQYASLLTDGDGTDTFYSENWDAHMVYFYDPAGNILELIARHTLQNATKAPFNAQSILNISEIGIATEDVAAQVADLQALTGAEKYHWSGNPAFTPVGDAYGLCIVVQRGRVWFPDTGKPAEHLPITAVVGTKAQSLTLNFN